MIVYKLTSPSGNSYIGITITTLKQRFQRHCNSTQCRTLKKALDKYGKETFSKEILYETDNRDDLLKKEKFFIEKYNTYNHGYNMTIGGDGIAGLKHSKKSKEKMRNAKLGKKASIETRKKMSETRKNINTDNGKHCYSINENGFIKFYKSQRELNRMSGISIRQLSRLMKPMGYSKKFKMEVGYRNGY